MKNCIFLFILIPVISFCQSGISISGSSQFHIGQSVLFQENQNFEPINHEVRNNKITLSIFRGKKFKIGTIAIKGSLAYNVNNTNYNSEENIINLSNYQIITRSLIPSFELWYIMFQNEKTFIYTSLGSYGIIQNLNINQNNSADLETSVYEYNGIVPFIRTGLQLNYGRFFINPFLSFDLEQIDFNTFRNIFETDLKKAINNHTIRTGLEFGVIF